MLGEPWLPPMQRVNLFPTVMPPPQTRFEFSIVIAPCFSPAVAIKGFQVDPGGYLPWMARSIKGLSGSVSSFWYSARPSFVVMRCEKRFGSNVGAEAMARISPLLGSMAIITPRPWGDFRN